VEDRDEQSRPSLLTAGCCADHLKSILAAPLQKRKGHVSPQADPGMGRHGAIHEVLDEGVMKDVDMKVEHLELIRPRSNAVQHDDVVWSWIVDIRVEPQGAVGKRLQPS
jgi:hypothetical protein